MKMRKIFISHSHKDSIYAESLIELLEEIKLNEDQIFCSSVDGYGVPLGKNFINDIHERLQEDTAVIFLLSENYYSSPICLCEMGASWILSKSIYPVVIPPLSFSDIKGVFPQNIGFRIDDVNKLSVFKDQIEEEFLISKTIKTVKWEKAKQKFLNSITAKSDIAAKIVDKKKESKTIETKKKKESIVDLIEIPPYRHNRIYDNVELNLKRPIFISKDNITNGQYNKVLDNDISTNEQSSLPIVNISFLEAVGFCNKLSILEGYQPLYKWTSSDKIDIDFTGSGYRLPNEFEWDCALKFRLTEIKEILNSENYIGLKKQNRAQAVGSWNCNEFGVSDMIGNIWEWCNDNYSDNVKVIDQNVNLQIENSKTRVVKGGSYTDIPETILKNRLRMKQYQKLKQNNCGIRLIFQY